MQQRRILEHGRLRVVMAHEFYRRINGLSERSVGRRRFEAVLNLDRCGLLAVGHVSLNAGPGIESSAKPTTRQRSAAHCASTLDTARTLGCRTFEELLTDVVVDDVVAIFTGIPGRQPLPFVHGERVC